MPTIRESDIKQEVIDTMRTKRLEARVLRDQRLEEERLEEERQKELEAQVC